MILSNEPGYYKTDAYGIRIENLELVVAADVAGAEKPVNCVRDADAGADRPPSDRSQHAERRRAELAQRLSRPRAATRSGRMLDDRDSRCGSTPQRRCYAEAASFRDVGVSQDPEFAFDVPQNDDVNCVPNNGIAAAFRNDRIRR